ncbi:MAG TPA: PQQ-binding-like beta-propeller repeat protein [Chthoniobacteraceae bacterium]|nr:PQQ-binding-like beta-propeller repeat protein [Chthoniobacteraceae bacterium]
MRPTCPLFALLWIQPTVSADDWPQWRGPQRDGISAETGWLSGWPENGLPRVAWRQQAGKGHSAVSVRDGAAYTMGWDGKEDTVFCFDAATGTVRWKQSYPCGDIVQWSGPRSTPAVDGQLVFTLGQHGQLRAWDAATGAPRWAIDLPKSYQPDADYGFTWSPLVEGGLLILGTGSKGLALRTKDGSFAWGNDGGAGACVSPMPFTLDGVRGVAVVAMDPSRDSVSVVGLELATGRELWRTEPWREKWGAACSDLVLHEGRVFLSTAEQHKLCAQFQFSPSPVREVWSNRKLSTYTGNVVLLADHLYGVDKTGILKCLDWQNGEERWAQRGFEEHGTLIAADGKLIIQLGKSGALAVVEATSAGYRELRRMKVFAESAASFTAPVLADGRLYCRSYAGEIVCLSLATNQ